MMYQNKLVTAIKVNGRILRETHGTVLIPFGSEYSILVKNLNSVRAKVKISVDGDDATGSTWLVIGPNSQTELERFIRNGNWQSGNRFKFIERTGDVEAHRGIQAEDGIVRVEYATERRVVDMPIVRHHYYDQWHPRPIPYYPPTWTYTSSGGSASASLNSSRSLGSSETKSMGGGASAGEVVSCAASGEAGITVSGSVSHQAFHGVADFPTDQSDVMVLMLRGIVAGQAVEAPVTVQTKRTCGSCGKVSKSDVAFCAGCGTALTLI